ncbi:hypothetical protein Franean1_4468 [Parafrankia sp. EAN1pec]|uniref:IS3 family transposase n=1 Tax=Parafrankia sp. (strain EAN1pec) TaxID=298653 RepID=UPI0000540E55|nr:hypothetical protein Franean1_4468 [Frankia sp. EAN1pec]
MSDTFEFIDAEYAARTTTNTSAPAPSVIQMCAWLSVSRSGFYEWRDRPASATATRRGALATLVVRSFTASDGTYGYRRVHADLLAWGRPCSPELVRALMREQGLVPCQPRPWRHTLTEPGQTPAAIPDLLQRDFTADTPGTKMVGDITYIPTWEGWLYLATVIDCHTKAVIGWAMDDNYKTGLIETAITMAARNHQLTDGAIFHSDRGSNGGFNWSSQHLDPEVWEWDGRRIGRRRSRGGRGCARRGGRRWRGGSISSGSGPRSRVG